MTSIFLLTLFFRVSIPFVNCNIRVAVSMSNRTRENSNHGNEESSQKGAGKEGGKKGGTEEEVVFTGNRQHIWGAR